MFLKKITFWLMLTLSCTEENSAFCSEDLQAVACKPIRLTLCDLQGFAERAKQNTVIAV
jgi:hypothetical protein